MAISDSNGVEFASSDPFYDYILNDIFLPAVADTVITPNTLLERLPRDKERVEGKNVVFPVHVGRNIGVNAIAAGGDLPDPGQQDYDQYSFGIKHIYGRVKFDGVSADASRTQMAAWLKAIESEVRGLGIDMSRYKQRASHLNGTGVLAKTAAHGSGAVTTLALEPPTLWPEATAGAAPDINHAKYLKVGMRIAFVSDTSANSQTQYAMAADSIRTITGITRTAGSEAITFASWDPVNDGNNWNIVLAGNADAGFTLADTAFENDPMGIAGIVDDGNPGRATSFQGINATDAANDWHRSTVLTAGSARALTIALMDEAFTTAMETGDAAPTALVTSFGVARKYAALLLSERRYNTSGGAMDLDGGYTALDYNGVPVIADRDCLNNRIYFLHEPDLRMYVLSDPQWMNKDGSIYHRLENKDAYQATMYCRETMGTDVRDKHVLLAAIDE